jgi:predicted DNA-binding transcriptional regulator AlpA
MKTPPLKTDQDGRYLIPLQKFAAMLSMSRETLYRKINAGLIPAPLKQGRRSFYVLSDAEAYLGNLKRNLS